jgi:thiol-disulfide isomerase/thioredoxin
VKREFCRGFLVLARAIGLLSLSFIWESNLSLAAVTVDELAASSSSPSPILQAIVQDSVWLNTSRALNVEELKGRILLLDFWTFCCINCMHIIPDLHAFEQEFGSDLTVIGVHSAKFQNEKDTDNIRSAILRYEIQHPVVNDADFKIWQSFGVNQWPTLVLINPDGKVEKVYAGEGHLEDLRSNINELKAAIVEKKGKLNTSPLPLALEKEKAPASVLRFPGKLAYDPDDQLLFISDSNHHRIVATRLTGEIAYTIGQEGLSGKKDGSFSGTAEGAQFFRPQGLLYQNHMLYIADTENHLLRQADLKLKKVTTLAGTGVQGFEREPKKAPALKTPLSSPWALGIMPRTQSRKKSESLVIAMAGTHQLWTYDLAKKTVSVIAGNGREYIDDGKYPDNSLSQPSGLSVTGNQVYFVDSETSSLRLLATSGKITTLMGTGLFDFGFRDGKRGEGQLQHPLGLWADDSGIYISDTYNHSIRKYDPKSLKLETIAGNGKKGFKDGELAIASFYEPGDIIRIQGLFYIADTNNHQIRILDPVKNKVTTLMIYFPEPKQRVDEKSLDVAEAPSARQPEKFLPRLKKVDNLLLKSGNSVTFEIQVSPDWEINKRAPSWLSIYEKLPAGQYRLLKAYKQSDLAKLKITFPTLKAGGNYRIQGTFYYCKEGVGALCNIQSRDQELRVGGGASNQITVELK